MGIAGAGVAIAGATLAANVGTQLAGSSGASGAVAAGQSGANAAQTGQMSQNSANLQPYVNTGQNALTAEASINGLNGVDAQNQAMSGFTASPGYQYQLSQGLNAVDNGAASKGLLRSGSTLRAEQTLGTNLANQDFSNYYSRLNGLATLGSSSAAGLATANGQQASGVASTDASAGAANASIYGGTTNALAGDANTFLNNKTVQNGLTSLFTPSTPVGSVGAPGTASFGFGSAIPSLNSGTP